MVKEDYPTQEFYDPQRLGWDEISTWRETADPTLQTIERLVNEDRCQEAQQHINSILSTSLTNGAPFSQELLKLRNALYFSKQLAHPSNLTSTSYADKELLDLSPKTNALLEVHAYTNEPLEIIEQKLKQEVPVKEAWNKAAPTNAEERKTFYEETDSYIYELMAVNNIVEIANWYVELSQKLSKLDIDTVLDYGAGAGNMALLLATQGFNVTYADLPSKTADFAAWRFKQRGLDIPMHTINDQYAIKGHPDCIICTEVIEHVEDPDALMKQFSNSLKPGKYLAISESFMFTQFASHIPGNEHKGGNNFSTYAKNFGFEEVLPWPALPQRVFQKK